MRCNVGSASLRGEIIILELFSRPVVNGGRVQGGPRGEGGSVVNAFTVPSAGSKKEQFGNIMWQRENCSNTQQPGGRPRGRQVLIACLNL